MTNEPPRTRAARDERDVRAGGMGAGGRGAGAAVGFAGAFAASSGAVAGGMVFAADEGVAGRAGADRAGAGRALGAAELAGLVVGAAGRAGVGVALDGVPAGFTSVTPCSLAAAASRRDAFAWRAAADFFAMFESPTMDDGPHQALMRWYSSQYSA